MIEKLVEFKQKDVNDLQKVIFPIFLVFQKICVENNLTYFLLFGSLLGAVRHQGFIPWDDDMDVGMPRNDFEKFCEIAQGELPNYYFLQTHKTDSHYYLHFAKILDLRTRFLQYTDQMVGAKDGVFLDIFPIDNAPLSKAKQKRKILLLQMLEYRRWDMLIIPSDLKKMQTKRGKFLRFLSHILFFCVSQESAFSRVERILRWYSNKNTGKSWITTDIRIYSSKDFATTKSVPFYLDTVSIPAGFDHLLRQCYGDYTKLPDAKNRLPHHFAVLYDVSRVLGEQYGK